MFAGLARVIPDTFYSGLLYIYGHGHIHDEMDDRMNFAP